MKWPLENRGKIQITAYLASLFQSIQSIISIPKANLNLKIIDRNQIVNLTIFYFIECWLAVIESNIKNTNIDARKERENYLLNIIEKFKFPSNFHYLLKHAIFYFAIWNTHDILENWRGWLFIELLMNHRGMFYVIMRI